ncbi:MAG: carbohydrate binding domain-containing protein [Armatimonadia bacterium]
MVRSLVRLVLGLACAATVCGGIAQAQDISVKMVDTPVLTALQALSLQAGVKLAAQEGIAGNVAVNMDHVTLMSVLEEMCRQLGCKYEKTNDGYVLVKGQLPGTAATQAPGENRVTSGGFEGGLTGWVSLNGDGTTEIVADRVAGGRAAVKISGQIGDKPQGLQNWPPIPLVDARHYRFRMQYRTEGQPRVIVKLTTRDSKSGTPQYAAPESVVAGASTGQWAALENDFWVCESAEEATLSIHMQQSSGAVWIDDVSFEPIEFIGLQEQPTADLSYNSGFEEGVGEMPYGWCPASPNLWPLNTDTRQVFGEKVAFAWDHTMAHGGTSSLSISNQGGPDEATYLSWHRIMGLRRSCDYEASVWVKTEGVAKAYLIMRSDAPGPGYSSDNTPVITGTSDWTQYRVALKPKDVPNIERGKLTVFLALRGSGKVWFDDLQVTARPR